MTSRGPFRPVWLRPWHASGMQGPVCSWAAQPAGSQAGFLHMQMFAEPRAGPPFRELAVPSHQRQDGCAWDGSDPEKVSIRDGVETGGVPGVRQGAPPHGRSSR